ncbi:hypothetical protein PHLGIDRAFT_139757 [Phlebiopsis gigantea 11061_1 CR5-6]|uniref:Uncharacterized protein n=1 Tax=Phlebiopsis gigantea (strain 11061_1 CR5-6) TaxID=745531 RepID=A0A0C3SF05_PHLG1|nr:hypothetical protein PHLGIDRAFT_139757 [Phlebiopsis gigantea 11061_1 CR5-6]
MDELVSCVCALRQKEKKRNCRCGRGRISDAHSEQLAAHGFMEAPRGRAGPGSRPSSLWREWDAQPGEDRYTDTDPVRVPRDGVRFDVVWRRQRNERGQHFFLLPAHDGGAVQRWPPWRALNWQMCVLLRVKCVCTARTRELSLLGDCGYSIRSRARRGGWGIPARARDCERCACDGDRGPELLLQRGSEQHGEWLTSILPGINGGSGLHCLRVFLLHRRAPVQQTGVCRRCVSNVTLRQRADLANLVARTRDGKERSVGYRSAAACLMTQNFRRSLDVQGVYEGLQHRLKIRATSPPRYRGSDRTGRVLAPAIHGSRISVESRVGSIRTKDCTETRTGEARGSVWGKDEARLATTSGPAGNIAAVDRTGGSLWTRARFPLPIDRCGPDLETMRWLKRRDK